MGCIKTQHLEGNQEMGRKQLTGDNKLRVRRKLGNIGLETVRDYCSVHTTPKNLNAALFLGLGLTSTPIRHENGDFQKRSSNWKNLKMPLCVFNRETSVLKFI